MFLRTLAVSALAIGLFTPAAEAELIRDDRHDHGRFGVTIGGCRDGVCVSARYDRHRGSSCDHRRTYDRSHSRYWCDHHRKYHNYGKHNYYRPTTRCGSCGIYHPCWEYKCKRKNYRGRHNYNRAPIYYRPRPVYRRPCY